MRFFIKTQNKDNFRQLGSVLDNLHQGLRILAYSKESFHYVVEFSNKRLINEVEELSEVSKFETEKKYYGKNISNT